jgi:hypothetical protein
MTGEAEADADQQAAEPACSPILRFVFCPSGWSCSQSPRASRDWTRAPDGIVEPSPRPHVANVFLYLVNAAEFDGRAPLEQPAEHAHGLLRSLENKRDCLRQTFPVFIRVLHCARSALTGSMRLAWRAGR